MEYRNQGNDRLASYYEDLSLKHLGISLHPLQDSFAHTDDFVKTITIFGKTFYHYLYPGGVLLINQFQKGSLTQEFLKIGRPLNYILNVFERKLVFNGAESLLYCISSYCHRNNQFFKIPKNIKTYKHQGY